MPFTKKRKAIAIAETEPASNVVATPPAKRGRGRPSNTEKAAEIEQTAATPPKKRGRPAKLNASENAHTRIQTSSLAQPNNTTPIKAKKGKATADSSLRRSNRNPAGAESANIESSTTRANRGGNKGTTGSVVAVKETKASAKGKAKSASPVKTAPNGSTRGVAKKQSAKAKGKAKATTEDAPEDAESDTDSDPDLPAIEELTKRRGRKPNFSLDVLSSKAAHEASEDADEEDADEPNYWLMKAEPNSRIEKGKDVKFSIDDLKNAPEPEGWDGT